MLEWAFGISTLAAILIAVPLVPSAVYALMPRMSYSPDADRALTRFIKELETDLVAGNQGILGVAGAWGYGWPKMLVLFASTDALQAAQATGLLDQLAGRFAAVVKNDAAYGPGRKWFAAKEAVWGMTEGPQWDRLIAKRSFP